MDDMQVKRLIVMRHAKAGELPGGPDEERALRSRGRRDATAAGEWLRLRGLIPDLVLCSAARRARQTWQHVSAELGAAISVSHDRSLYHADAGELLAIVRQTPPVLATLMYVGHNPAAAELAAALTGADQDFPTSAIAVIELRGRWAEADAGQGELAASWTPQHVDRPAEGMPG
jgi:phosphohistidine phosphatase